MPAGEGVMGAGSDPARRTDEGATNIYSQDRDAGGAGLPSVDPSTPADAAELDEFARTLVEIGLVQEAELASFTVDAAAGVLSLSAALVKAGKLTTYQAAAVTQKKARGLLIGSYLILDKLGQGGMGMVFKARHRRSSRVGALKILPPSFARDRNAVLRFRREVEAAGLLKHPNLVAVFDADEDRGVQFLVMDYVDGHNLDQLVRDRGPMQVDRAVDCLIQAASGLEAAHAKGIIHRDIKPANLMLDHAGTVRVLDLGLARVVEAVNPFNKTEGNRLTQSGVYMGTIDYMAPEQAEDSHRVDHRGDIYSLGCTLYYLLTGQEPFWGETVLKRLMAHLNCPAPSLRILRPDVPPELDAAYLKMMAKRPDDRPGWMTEVIALLEASKTAPAFTAATSNAPSRSSSGLMVFNEQPLKRAGAPRTKADPSVFLRPKQSAGLMVNHDLSLSDLVMDFRPAPQPVAFVPAPGVGTGEIQPLLRLRPSRRRRRPRLDGLILLAIAATASVSLVVACVVWISRLPSRGSATTHTARNVSSGRNDRIAPGPPAQPPAATPAVNDPPQEPGHAVWQPRSSEVSPATVDHPKAPTTDVVVKEIARWGKVVNPDGDCLIHADGRALTITVPPTLHDLNVGIGLFNAPRVIRDVEGDFDIQVKVVGEFTPGSRSNREGGFPFNGAGIFVCKGDDSFIRLERGVILNGGSFRSFTIFEGHEGRSGVIDHNGPLDPGTVYLRLSRRGNRIMGLTSTDGRHWAQLQPIGANWPGMLKVGLSAINSGNATFTVRFEELLFKTASGGGAHR